jgi:hypothetical protein
MVMEKESAKDLALLQWYKREMNNLGGKPLMRFFNERRVHSIHKASVRLRSHSAPIFDLTINDEPASEPDPNARMEWWTFDGVNEFLPDSSNNVIGLCDEYFRTIRGLVAAWLYVKTNLEFDVTKLRRRV